MNSSSIALLLSCSNSISRTQTRSCKLATPSQTHPLELLHLMVMETRQSRIFQASYLAKVQELQLAAVAAHGEDTVCPQRGRYAHNPAQVKPPKASTTLRERRHGSVGRRASAAGRERRHWVCGAGLYARSEHRYARKESVEICSTIVVLLRYPVTS